VAEGAVSVGVGEVAVVADTEAGKFLAAFGLQVAQSVDRPPVQVEQVMWQLLQLPLRASW
jgi:hypothetical protein